MEKFAKKESRWIVQHDCLTLEFCVQCDRIFYLFFCSIFQSCLLGYSSKQLSLSVKNYLCIKSGDVIRCSKQKLEV